MSRFIPRIPPADEPAQSGPLCEKRPDYVQCEKAELFPLKRRVGLGRSKLVHQPDHPTAILAVATRQNRVDGRLRQTGQPAEHIACSFILVIPARAQGRFPNYPIEIAGRRHRCHWWAPSAPCQRVDAGRERIDGDVSHLRLSADHQRRLDGSDRHRKICPRKNTRFCPQSFPIHPLLS